MKETQFLDNYDISKVQPVMAGEKLKASLITDIQHQARLGIQAHKHINNEGVNTNGHACKLTTEELSDGIVTEVKLADRSVTTNKLGIDSVTCINIATDSIDNSNLSEKCVGSRNIDNEAIQRQHIAKYAIDIMTQLDCKLYELAFTNAPIILQHTLGRVPTGYLVISVDKPTVVYLTNKTDTTMTLCSSEVDSNATILIF